MSTNAVEAAVLTEVDALTSRMVAETVDLVRIPSVSGTDAENEAQDHMARVLAQGGMDIDHWRIDLSEMLAHPQFPGVEVERREAWGLVGKLAGVGDGPTLMLNGHIDVVPIGDPNAWKYDPFAATIVDGELHGRGACDMKAGVIAMHWAVQAVRNANVKLRGDVLIASVQGEEDGGLGTFAMLERGWRADACVITEPTDLDIVPANSGALTFRLRVHGLATHASRRTEGVSVIEKFWPIWNALHALEQRRHVGYDASTSKFTLLHPLSVGTIRAGDWASSVPELLVAEGRIGVALDESPAETRRQLEAAVADACAADEWLRDHQVGVEWWGGQFASGRLPEGSNLIDQVRAAHANARGNPQDVWTAPYGSDLRLLTGHGGIPTVQYGPGDVALAHGPMESVKIDDVATTARTLAMLMLDICGVA